MDAITHEEKMIGRASLPDGKAFQRALSLLCLGLVLISFNINIQKIELSLYTTWAGGVFLALGSWTLRGENGKLLTAYRLSIAQLIFRMLHYWIGAFPKNVTGVALFSPLAFAISLAITVVQIYYLFSGLGKLALDFEHADIATKLMCCFRHYLGLCVLILIGMLFPFLTIFIIPYALYVLIKLPLTVSRLKERVPFENGVLLAKGINKQVLFVLGLYVTIAIIGEIACLYYVNAPNPKSQPYTNIPSTVTMEIREKLLDLGMPDYVVNDLPDSEVIEYDGIYNATSEMMTSTEIANRDSGKLDIYAFIGIMPEGKVRTLFYYKWVKLPKHNYTDLLSIAMPLNSFVMYEDSKEMGLALYDNNGTTYSQTLQNNGKLLGQSNSNTTGILGASYEGRLVQIQFRLYPKYENQRGYVAVNTLVAQPSAPLNFNSWATYVHQESLWNRPHFNPINQTADSGYSHIRNTGHDTKAFWSEGFYTITEYEPEAFVWPEHTISITVTN